MADPLAAARAARKKEEEEREPRKPILQSWQEFNDLREIDDSLKGCTARLDAIDVIIEDFTEWLGNRPRRNYTRLSEA